MEHIFKIVYYSILPIAFTIQVLNILDKSPCLPHLSFQMFFSQAASMSMILPFSRPTLLYDTSILTTIPFELMVYFLSLLLLHRKLEL